MGKTLKSIALVAAGVTLVVLAPQIAAVIGVKAITAATIAAVGASLALSTASMALFGPKTPKSQISRLNVSLDPITARKSVFGTTAMPLDLRYHEASGTNQEFIDYIIAVAAHKVTSIDEIWFEEKQAWTAAGGVTATYNGFLTVTTRTEGTSANTIAINGGGKWGSSRRLTGCAYVHLRIKRTGATSKTQSPLVNGLPSRVTIIGNGALLYDPRKDSTVPGGSGTHRAADQTTWGAYTDADDCDNPALQLLWWLLGWKINGKLSIGCGVPANRIDIASFITAANICDENVTLAIGGTQKRYRTSGTASDSDNRMDIINTFLTSMNGTLRDNGGKLTLSLMKNDLANYSLDLSENDMLGEFEWQQTRGLTESYNVIRGRYVDPSVNSLYQPVDYPEVSIASADGIERATTLDLMYVEDGRRAQRIAKQVLQRNQYRGMFSATFNTKALGCQVGDVVRLTVSSLGWTNKLFRVVSQEIRFDGQVPLALVEENAAIYAWSNEDQAPVVPTSPTIYNPLNDPFILGLVDAQAIADGKIDSYYQTEPPTGATEGDYWTDTNDANKLYRYTSGAWVSIQDGGIPTAISAAAGAQATANGKVTTYYSETTPTATAIGDLWYKPSTGFVQRWNGSAWADVATLGATIGENVKDKSGNPVAIEAIRNNLALIDWWKKGATIPWTQNAEYNAILSSSGDMAGNPPPPIRGHEDLWFCQEVTGNSEQGGGWNDAPIAPLDPDKAYRFLLPIFNRNGDGSAYWGIQNVADLNTTTLNTNPYFASAVLPNYDRWYLFVGYIFPRNSIGKTSSSAGVWDCKTGNKVFDGLNYCFLPSGAQPTNRAYQYYASNGSQKVFGRPLIEPIESMSDMTLYFEEAARLNNAIGVNASGQFINPVGAGNNTVVANTQITVDGSGQLAGIGTGNNTVVANTQINITSGNLNGIGTGSGTTVANNQIAVNVSGQISGIGTGNLTEVGNDRMDITFDTLGTDGRVRAQLRRNGGTTVNTTIQLPSAAQNADQLWNQVSGTGRPQDNATVGARAGTNLYRNDGTTILTQAEVLTAEGTAAAILNQAATATNSDFSAVTGTTKPENNATVGATAGTNLRRSNATVLSDNDIITSLGTAALIANQGPGATAIASDVLNNRIESNVVRIRQPVGGTLQNQNANTPGAIRIQLPILENNGFDSMIRFFVDVFEYVDNRMQTYEIAGYNWHSTGNWLTTSARMIGNSGAARPVRFGRSGGRWAIWIGDHTGSWQYPAAVVRDLQISYNNLDVNLWDDGWTMVFDQTAPTNVSKTVSNPNAGDAVFGVNALETWNGAVATLPNFKTIEGTAAAISGQAATATSSDFSVVTGTTKPENNATVGATAGTNLRRANATVLNDGDIITSLGTAALIAGQGALATKSAVDLATAEVLNKSLANVDATASTKLGGIQAGATVGARAGTNLYRSDGTTVMTQAEVRTAEGTAAAISGQAATATNSDFSAVTGTTKPENNATVGARAGTNLRRSNNTVVSDAQVLNESQQWTQVNSRPLLITGDAITADELLIDPSVWGGTPANWFYLDVDSTGYVEVPAGSGNTLVTNFANATPIDHSATYEAEWEILETGSGAPTSAYYTVVSCWDSAGNLIGQDGTYWYYPSAYQQNIGRGSYERRLARFGKGTARPFPENAAKFGVGVLLNYNGAAVITRARRIRARRIDAENLGVNGDASRWQFANRTAIRWSGGSGWGISTARSKSALVGAQSVSFDAVTSPAMCGFTDAASPASYNDIDYAWYYADGGLLQIYENGNYVWGTSGYTNPDDVRLRIEYDGNFINYYVNGAVARSLVAGPDRSFRVAVDNFRNGSGFRNINHVSTESNAYIGVNTYNSTGGAWSAENGATIGATAGTNLRRSNATVLGDNDIITSLGTAANIAGQAATATSSDFSAVTGSTKPENNATVGATAGTNLRRSNATVLNDGDIITSLGTAANINNQGALATRSNARLGNEVVDEGGNAIAAEFIRNNVNRGNVGTMAYPSGGTFAAEVNGLTGAVQIMLPNTFADGRYTMIKFQVDIYNYSTDTSVTYDISGYVYPILAAPTWYNMTAKVVGGGVGSAKPVRFGRTGSASTDKFCVWIGDTNSVWYYPKVQVRNVMTGYSSIDVAFWQSGWAVSTVTAFGTVDASVLNPTAGDAVFGVNAREEWNGAVATLPNFKTIQGTAAAITSQGALATKSSVATADISANAVTTGSSAFGDSSIDLTTSWQTMASCTVTMSGGAARVDFCALINGQADSTGCPVNIRLLRNGTSIRETNLTILPGEQTFYTGNFGEYAVVVKTPVTGSFPMFLVDTSGATGSVEFIVQLKLGNANADFASAAHRQIVATEFKR